MTYIKDKIEYLTWDENRVWLAIGHLTGAGRTGNNSQIASWTGLSRTKVGNITRMLQARGFIMDAAKAGAAYHWRQTDKPVNPQAPRPLTAIVSSADLARPGESLSANDWVGREPGESLEDFRARRDGMTPRQVAQMNITEDDLADALRDLDVIRGPGQSPMSYDELARAIMAQLPGGGLS